ncbi:anthranilate synthase alpha subunit 1, chloroplastic-like isoform X2 [Dendrobium catenatum]|uniref:anthranilate synthase alpha subunit 1, chloroplastic-like isoform X2 n=1 Tax=Dendrobium catenatum TaxID=906689 RepID=UPI0009F3A4FC|nr:anthranilate synthase alpha subunit 1, chloroplastic-like isoform X2 [Dendrobium catenatum]
MHGALGSVKATLSPSTGLVLTLLPSLVSMAYINSSAPNHFQLLSSAISLFAIVMGALALSSRVSSFSLSHGVVAFPTSTGTTRHPLLGFSHRPHLKCFAAALSSSVSVPTVEKEELARFAYAVEMGSNLVPLYRCIFCDHLTPILAYRCLVEEDDTESPSFLFESVEQGLTGSSVGRYSVLGANPVMEIISKENMVSIVDRMQGLRTEEFVDDPMIIPRRIMEGWSPLFMEELPDVFCGGWLGYFSYDTMRYVERRRLPFSSAPKDDRNLPDINLGLYNDVIVFDHVEKKAYVIHWVHLRHYSSIEDAYQNGRNRLEAMLSRLQNMELPRLSTGSVKFHTSHFGAPLKRSTITAEEYKQAVLQAKEHIFAGDIFQVVLSQRFERRTFATPFEVYRALRIVNPSPYMAYVQARGCILVASSPEILTRVKKRKIVNRPLAGTVRRGMSEKADKMQEQLLLIDEKERAEHIMLVDLGRNDVGKVSKFGSVKVDKLMNIERYSHVMHISSTISGELFDHLNSWDALRAALPVGTVSGAPKVRAMELIDKLEVRRRGPYSGGFGGISFNGDMDIALALRTMVFPTANRYNSRYSFNNLNWRQEWVADLQAGAGIVADSNPDEEQRECENKVAALAFAIDLAENTFVKL